MSSPLSPAALLLRGPLPASQEPPSPGFSPALGLPPLLIVIFLMDVMWRLITVFF